LQTAGRYCSGTALNLCARIDERWLAAREGNLRRLIDDRVRDDGFWILYPERVRSSALTFFCLAPLVLPIRCLEEGQIYPPNQHRLATLHFLSGVHCVAPNYVPARVIVVRLYRNGGDRTEDEDTAVQLHVNGDRHIGCLLGLRTRRKTSGYHGCYQTASPRSELSSKLLILWSHPPGSNRRPADYEESSPVPSAPLALYGSACYQQLGEAALAQTATQGGPIRWGFGTVLAQESNGATPIRSPCLENGEA